MEHIEQHEILMRILMVSLLLISGIIAHAQEKINQLDSEGRRHGLWKKYYDEDENQLRYEGTFEHGREKGLFRFYQPGQDHPAATKLFSVENDTVEVKFFTQRKNLISEGKMKDSLRIGLWKYYHQNSDKLMMTENYKNGNLEGEKITYYENGTPAERSFYSNGQLEGEKIMYSVKGVVLEHLTYTNGELHGPAKFYNGKGELVTEGNYKNDRHYGVWKYYENGKLKQEKDFSSQK